MPHDSMLPFFHKLADAADAITRQNFRAPLAVESKSSLFDPVTLADKGAEEAMRHLIKTEYPAHGIMGEEFGIENPNAEFQWLLDPIDGTRAYITGTPTWGTLIGLMHMNAPFMGMVSQGFTGERWWGDGAMAYYALCGHTKSRLQTSSTHSISKARIATTSPDLFATAEDLAAFNSLNSQVQLCRYGGDCYNYMALAMGQVDAVVESGLKPYDIMPLIPIIEGAGGIVTTWDGKPAQNGGQIIAAANAELHKEMCEYLVG